MTNAHLQTAASNIRQAVGDLTQQQRDIENALINDKSTAHDKIESMRDQITRMQATISQEGVDENTKIANNAAIQNLQVEISKIEQDMNRHEQDVKNQIEGVIKQQQNYSSLAEQLENAS